MTKPIAPASASAISGKLLRAVLGHLTGQFSDDFRRDSAASEVTPQQEQTDADKREKKQRDRWGWGRVKWPGGHRWSGKAGSCELVKSHEMISASLPVQR